MKTYDLSACLQSGDWSKVPKDIAVVCNELNYLGQVVLRGIRIVIPEKLQKRVLDPAHEGHQGIVKMRALKVQSMAAWDRSTHREAM